VICRHGLFGRLIVDGGPEFRGEVIELLRKRDIRRIVVSPYHAQSNGMIERGHKPIVDALAKLTGQFGGRWEHHLHAVLWADRTTVHRPTGHTPFYMLHGREAVVPVESRYATWRTLEWSKARDREELLALRARQFEIRDQDLEEAVLRKKRVRQEGKEAFDKRHNIKKRPLEVGDIVLKHDTVRKIDKSRKRKLDYRWLGPYRIIAANPIKGNYTLAELDGTELKGTIAGFRIKPFVQRDGFFYSIDDEVESSSNSEAREDINYKSDATEIEGENQETVQIRRSDDTVVRIQVPQLTEEQKRQYVVFDDWSEEETEN
jgi:hypothetical protein